MEHPSFEEMAIVDLIARLEYDRYFNGHCTREEALESALYAALRELRQLEEDIAIRVMMEMSSDDEGSILE